MSSTAYITIAEARVSAGLTQNDVAAEAGVSRGTYWNWEANRCALTDRAALRRIARLLGVPASRLVQ
jgi:transcriptional regulator with XRE-family HTH domain